jgi:hypothetical protein
MTATPKTFVSKTARRFSRSVGLGCGDCAIPALLIRMSRWPNFCLTISAAARMVSSLSSSITTGVKSARSELVSAAMALVCVFAGEGFEGFVAEALVAAGDEDDGLGGHDVDEYSTVAVLFILCRDLGELGGVLSSLIYAVVGVYKSEIWASRLGNRFPIG